MGEGGAIFSAELASALPTVRASFLQGGNMNGSDAHPASTGEEISESKVT